MKIVFVCTGNICRSPMAEALATHRAPGVVAASAGTAAVDGHPASHLAVVVMREIGIDLAGHRSQPLATALDGDRPPDRIYAMEAAHAAWVRSRYPGLASTVELLDSEGRDIADPYGLDVDAYRTARRVIEEAVTARVAEWS